MKFLEQEQKALRVALIYAHELDPSLTFESIAQTLVNFIRFSRNQQSSVDIIIEAIDLLGSLIENPIYGEYDDPEAIKLKIQNQLNDFGAGKVALTLMCDADINPQVFIALLGFAIELLEGGNQNVQQEFYQFFINVTFSEMFFQRIHKLFLECIERIAHGPVLEINRIPIFKTEKPKIRLILRLMQLLCENHNDKLQNYMRHQEKSRNSYDMIESTISLLEILTKKMHFKSFHVISQCFDTLTEFIQGPCKLNQERIIDSKFLELAAFILSLDEKSDEAQPYGAFKTEKTPLSFESAKSSDIYEGFDYIKG